MDTIERQTPRFFDAEVVPSAATRFLNGVSQYRQVGLMILSCALGLWLIFHFRNSDQPITMLCRILGVFFNFPLLLVFYRGYQVLLAPLAQSYADWPLHSALDSPTDASEA
jgi:hypothetical protein